MLVMNLILGPPISKKGAGRKRSGRTAFRAKLHKILLFPDLTPCQKVRERQRANSSGSPAARVLNQPDVMPTVEA
jgi:hypothetical protein